MSDHELILGDCLDPLTGLASLADKSVDHVLTDPPYSEYVHSRSRRGCIELEPGTGRAAFNRNRDLGFVSLTADVMEAVSQEFGRIARRWVGVFSDTESDHLWRAALQRAGLEYVRTSFWRKRGGTPQFTGDRPAVACEAITLAHPPGRKVWNAGGKQGFYDVPIMLDRSGTGERIHSAQKPLQLLEELLVDHTDVGDVVVDPFAGSGTTLVAAKRLGRRAIGWEKDATFWERAVRRLENTKQQFELLPRGPKPKQQKMVLP